MRVNIGPLSLVFILLSSCSLFGIEEEIPERQFSFTLITYPAPDCTTYQPNCILTYEGVLTKKDTVEADVNNRFLRLVFDESLFKAELWYVTRLNVPLTFGTKYRVTANTYFNLRYRSPSVEVVDANGLNFYAKTEYFVADTHNPPLPTGWTVSLESGDYGTNKLGCGLRGTPQVLVVSHSGKSVRLVQGESKRLGKYLVTALVAEKVDYTGLNCLDFVAPEVSYTIARVPE